MKIASIRLRKLASAVLLTGCFLGSLISPARAGLGADASAIESDAAALHGNMSQPSKEALAQTGSYKVKSFVTESGTAVREYAAPSGATFGVAWNGRRPPDLSVLLGSYYPEYVSAMSIKHHRDLHHTMIQTPHTLVVMGGHMGHLVGRAYAPGLAPSGVDAKAVVK